MSRCMKGTIIASLLALAAAAAAFAGEDALAQFNRAGQLYADGRYQDAAALYETLQHGGRANAALYYNLGNAFYRTQRIGRAIACYERALRLSPRDGDAAANLEFLRRQAGEPPAPFPASALLALGGLVSLNELTLLCSAVYLLSAGLAAAWLFTRRRRFLFAVIPAAALLLLLAGGLLLKMRWEVFTRRAVVVSGPLEVRNGPGAANSVGFTLPEGRAVTVLGEQDGWAAVALPAEGLKGWVEKASVEEL